MLRIIDVATHCRARDLFYDPMGDGFIAQAQDVQVFSVGCLNSEDGCMVRGLSSGYYDANVALQLEHYLTPDVSLKIPDGDQIDEAVLLWGDKNFGHWIFTYLNRLPLLFHKPELLDIPLMVLQSTPVTFLRWLNRMGFHDYFMAPDGSRVETLWVPSVAHYRDERKQVHTSGDAVHIFRHLMLRGGGGRERIYMSRANAQWRRVTNEDDFVAMLARHGIRRVFIEALSVEDQIDLISRCELIVSVIGGASPITMLAPKTCRIVEIGLPGFSGVFGSRAWAEILGQPYRRIDGAPVAKGINSDFSVDVDAVEKLCA